MKAKELRSLAVGDLHKKLAEFRRELFNLRFQHATAQLENTQRIPQVKRDIARVLTILREKELESQNASK
ncbi:MAG: 50S ribosomal protein L29 [Desulfonauticus sp.]|nr:50S ribosomal protein L29 [Desulfonauticus sp.]